MSLIGKRNYGNGKTTLEKGGTNPPDDTISEIVQKLLCFFSIFESLNKIKKQIEKKYCVKKDCSGCWPEDDIKRAWGKTQRMKQTSNTRQLWSYAILLQLTKLTWSKIIPELSLNDSPEELEADLENVSSKAEDIVCSPDVSTNTCGTEPSMTGNTQDRSQSGAELKKNEQEDKTPSTWFTYIKIPFTTFFGEESSLSTEWVEQSVISSFKLIDKVPLYDKTNSEIRKRKSYIMSYNKTTMNADWVYEILNKSILKKKCKEQMTFGKIELENKDCNQGHLAAAANHIWCQEAYHDTFLMSNMAPQNKSLNQGMWSELEQRCRDFVKDTSVCNVHVYTGPLYPDKKQKKKESVKPLKKAVPTDFFKVVIVEKNDGTVEEPECYVIPNEQIKLNLLDNFRVNLNTFHQDYPFTFIERDEKSDVQLRKTVTLTGEDGNGELHSVDISVILTPRN